VDRLTKRRVEAARVERFVKAKPVIAKSKYDQLVRLVTS
jgi:hypothetical protein